MMSCGSVDGDVIIIDVSVWTAPSVFYGLGAKGRELSSGDRRLLSVFHSPPIVAHIYCISYVPISQQMDTSVTSSGRPTECFNSRTDHSFRSKGDRVTHKQATVDSCGITC